VAVIGGGIGGMEAARILTLRGHHAEIYEKSGELGGIFIAAAAPDFKEKDKKLIDWFKLQIEKLEIPVHLNTEVTDIPSLGADEVIIATGSVANRIPVPGIDHGIQAVDFLLGKKSVGQKVVIIGGGLTGCEIAYELYLQGKEPVIVEMKEDLIAVPGVALANTSFLRDFFKANKVAVHLETKLEQVMADGVKVQNKDGLSFKIDADSVILSTGYRSAPIAQKGKHVHIIGDACKVGNLRTVIWQAWDVCMKL
jgi:2-enoate reductase